jgi:hypothetical protein
MKYVLPTHLQSLGSPSVATVDRSGGRHVLASADEPPAVDEPAVDAPVPAGSLRLVDPVNLHWQRMHAIIDRLSAPDARTAAHSADPDDWLSSYSGVEDIETITGSGGDQTFESEEVSSDALLASSAVSRARIAAYGK